MLHKDNCKPIREELEFLDLVRLILEILRYFLWNCPQADVNVTGLHRWQVNTGSGDGLVLSEPMLTMTNDSVCHH